MTHSVPKVLLFVTLIFETAVAFSQHQNAAEATAIRSVMDRSAADWNRGDITAFAECYQHEPDVLLIGPTNRTGFEAMLQSYRKNYPTAEARGVLSYSNIEVQPLDKQFATVTGHFHLERKLEGGGSVDGYYLLVFERAHGRWGIVRDASVLLPPAGSK